jgi:hypothetical protein
MQAYWITSSATARRLPAPSAHLGGCLLMTRSSLIGCSSGNVRGVQRASDCNYLHCYSMTSVTRISSDNGISIPSDFAVCRFTTTSNLVDSSTGKSAGFAPLRILLT